MSAEPVTRILIACDTMTSIGTCHARREWAAADTPAARALAARAGWSHRDGKDHCPIHTPRTPA